MMRRRALASAVAALAALTTAALSSCATFGIYPEDSLAGRRAALRDEAGPLAGVPDDPAADGPAIAAYRARLAAIAKGRAFDGSLEFGTVPWRGSPRKGGSLGVILIRPPAGVPVRGTIVAWHGYLSYSAFNVPALCALADRGWAVLAADLPGHGFSDGLNGWIPSFGAYAEATRGLLDWLDARPGDFPGPRVALGHSGGSAATIESLLALTGRLDAGILLAPLVRPRNFAGPRLAAIALAPFVSAVPPRGAEEGFLGASYLPLSWVRRLGAWGDRLPRRTPVPGVPVLAVWGDRDGEVDLSAARSTLPALFPDWRQVVIEGGGHVLLNGGSAEARTLAAIGTFLDEIFPADHRADDASVTDADKTEP